jgi:hypothetical protein
MTSPGRHAAWLLALAIALAAPPAPARVLVRNGDFELPPDSSWELTVWGDFPDTGNCRLRYRHEFHPDRDFEVLVYKMLHEGMRLSQKVVIPNTDLGFGVSCRLWAKTERESLFAAACVCVEYLDRSDSVLGETRIFAATSGCDWSSSPVLHLIRVSDSLNWYDYRFDVASELDSLPGVERDSIRAVKVSLLGYVKQNC